MNTTALEIRGWGINASSSVQWRAEESVVHFAALGKMYWRAFRPPPTFFFRFWEFLIDLFRNF